MKFSNVVAYCKGFYKTREGDVPMMWKDMAHCITCDGWTVFDRKDVARWCMHRLEEFAKEFPEDAWQVSFSIFYGKIENNKEIVRVGRRYSILSRELDDMDYIIWTYRDFVRYLDGDKFTEGVVPNDAVLPVDRENISETLWKNITDKYQEQDTDKWYFESYDEREERFKD